MLDDHHQAMAELLVLKYIESHHSKFSEAKANWGDGESDVQIEANLAVLDHILAQFADKPSDCTDEDAIGIMCAIDRAALENRGAEFQHFCTVAQGLYRGYMQGVLHTLSAVSSH